MPADLVTTLVVVVAVSFGLWLVWYGLPWLIDHEEPEVQVPADEIIDRVQSERS